MESGISRRIDELGRIVIPSETRRLLNIAPGDQLTFATNGNGVVIRKLTATCTFCGSAEAVSAFRGKGLCQSCRTEISDSASE